MGWSANNIGQWTGMSRSASNVGERIEKWSICLQFRLANQPAKLLEFILVFRLDSNLFAGVSTVLARPVDSSASSLTWRVNRLASKLVRTDTQSVSNDNLSSGIWRRDKFFIVNNMMRLLYDLLALIGNLIYSM